MSAVLQTVFEFGDFRIDPRKRVLARRNGEVIALTPKHFDTLLYLVENADEVLEKDRIMDAIWPRMVVEENNLNQAVSQLRRILGDDGTEHRFILTVPRRGYRFVAEVHATEDLPASSRPGPAVEAVVEPAFPVPVSSRPAAPIAPATNDAAIRPVSNWRRFAIAGAAIVVLAVVAMIAWRMSWRFSIPMPAADKIVSNDSPGEKSIAVLPFVNFSGAKEDEFFSEGITEDMVTQLAQISGLKVISRTSILEYKDSKKPLRDIARELGVAHILQGSVRRSETRFRINAQLIDPARDGHLWAKSYDRDIKDVLAVQSEVTAEIAAALKARLLEPEKDQLDKRARRNPEAYVAYLQGMHILRHRIVLSMTEYEKSVPYFDRVIALDPDSPLGYVGLAKFNLSQAQLGLSSAENYAKAEKLILRAIAVDAESAEAYIVLATIKGQGQWSWKEAEQASTRAIQLNPGNAAAWDTYRQNVLQPMARVEEAIIAQKRAISLDPVNAYLTWRLALQYVNQGQCDEAMRVARQAIEIDPSFTISHTIFVDCLEQLGRFEEAIAANRLVKGYWVNDALLDDAVAAYKRDGSSGYYRVFYDFQKRLSATRNDAFMFTAGFAMQLGERDEAFRLLNQAIDARDRNIFMLKTYFKFASVRDDPRYLAALKRLNLN